MPNPAADFPTTIHSETDTVALANQKLGLSSPTHPAVEGKQEKEIIAVQMKIGTGASTPVSGRVLAGTGIGTSSWQTLASAGISEVGHTHDDRYFTESELNAGQLDSRYYTEAELNAGQLDSRYYTEAEINSLINNYSLVGHTHTLDNLSDVVIASVADGELLVYDSATGDWINQTLAEAGISAVGHTHDDRYFTETELNAGQLNNLYYTESEITTLLAGKSDTGHTHDHGTLTGLADDDHTIYALLAGRSGGQTLRGGTGASENLTLQSTSNATKGKIFLGAAAVFDEANTRLGIGTTTPDEAVHTIGNFLLEDAETATKGYRFRTTGTNLDIDGAGKDLYVSVYSGVGFSGTQRTYLQFGAEFEFAKASKKWIFTDGDGADWLVVDGAGGGFVVNESGIDRDTRIEGDTDTHLIFVDAGVNMVGIGVAAPNEKLTVGDRLSLKETTAPTATSGYGKIYVKSSDSKLYFMNDAGAETDLTAGGGGGATTIDGLTDVTITSVGDNEVLQYDSGSSQWINQTLAEAGIAAASHTHTASAITDFAEAVDDRVATLVVAGSGISATYDDGANTLTIAATIDTINELTDVTITSVADGEVLVYDTDTSQWINQTLAEAGIAATGHNHDSTYLALAGGTMAGAIAMGTNKITGLGDPTSAQDAATKNYVDTKKPTLSKSIAVESPTNTDDLTLFYTTEAITITKYRAVLIGSSTPSVTYTIRHSSDRSATGNEVNTSGDTVTSTTTGTEVNSGFEDATIPAGSFVWIEITGVSGTVTQFALTIEYTEDA